MMWHNFRLALLRITYLPLAPLQFSGHVGVVLRGAMGAALKHVCCITKEECEKGCAHPHICPYGRLFETPIPPNSPVFADQPSAARPFVIEPPTGDEWRVRGDKSPRIKHHASLPTYAPGDKLIFHLVLIGNALDYLPYFVYALIRAGEKGIGKAQCALERIETLRCREDSEPSLVYSGAAKTLFDTLHVLTGAEIVTRYQESCDPSSPSCVLVEFLTPTQLTKAGKVVHKPDFETIIRALLRRLVALAYFHCGFELKLDFKGLVARAKQVVTAASELSTVRFSRFSKRQEQDVWLGGFLGSVTFKEVPEEFLPLLRLGEYVHVGKGTVYGLGQFEVSW